MPRSDASSGDWCSDLSHCHSFSKIVLNAGRHVREATPLPVGPRTIERTIGNGYA
jgi:hypothetical protein